MKIPAVIISRLVSHWIKKIGDLCVLGALSVFSGKNIPVIASMMKDLHDVPTLFIFSGLPGAGKTTIAQRLVKSVGAIYLRIDTIEQALRDFCAVDVHSEGYDLAYRLAADNLKLGINVVADSCNPIELTRDEWQRVALESEARYVNIEIVCSNQIEHRRRIESRISTVPGLKLPTWNDIENREYHRWTKDRIIIDTSDRSETECFDELSSKLLFSFA